MNAPQNNAPPMNAPPMNAPPMNAPQNNAQMLRDIANRMDGAGGAGGMDESGQNNAQMDESGQNKNTAPFSDYHDNGHGHEHFLGVNNIVKPIRKFLGLNKNNNTNANANDNEDIDDEGNDDEGGDEEGEDGDNENHVESNEGFQGNDEEEIYTVNNNVNRFFSFDLLLRSLLYACLFYILAHPDTSAFLTKRLFKTLAKSNVLYVLMTVFLVVYYLLNLFI
jgi:hypothetical protein